MPIVETDAIKNPSPQLQAVLRWLNALITECDVEALGAAITDDYRHQTLPKTLSMPARDKASFLAFCGSVIMPMIPTFTATIHEVVQNADTVVIHSSDTGTSATGAPYANENIIVYHVVKQADGEYKVSSTKELVDSKALLEFMGAEAGRREAAAKAATAA